jgi:glutamyl/glutaminyl-tRNA synthetase
MSFTRTRIAPTPSGFLHIGNIFSFSLTAGLARRHGASILLRIDDLDRERFSRDFLEDIFDTLRFLEIPWDEGPVDADDFERRWSQVRRLSLYSGALERLRSSGLVFACSCSRAELARAGGDGGYAGTCRERGLSLDGAEMSWRLRTGGLSMAGDGLSGAPGGLSTGTGERAGMELPAEMRDFVVRKKNGFPAYQLSSVVDDLHFGVDLVVRGEDLRASTLAQLCLADVLAAAGMDEAADFGRVRFIHHPLLMAADGEKLSKSAGATSIQYLRKQGLSPAEVFTLIARAAGLAEPILNWEQLATQLFALGYGPDQ